MVPNVILKVIPKLVPEIGIKNGGTRKVAKIILKVVSEQFQMLYQKWYQCDAKIIPKCLSLVVPKGLKIILC